MNHEPFERLLLTDRPLTAAEADELRRHLRDCGSCRALQARWATVETAFESVALAEPAPGFAARMMARAAKEASRRAQRQAWRLFGWISVGATALAGLLVLLLLRNPSYLSSLFAQMLEQGLRLWLWARVAGEVTGAFVSTAPLPVTGAAVIVSVGVIAGVGVLAALGTFGIIRFSSQGVRT